VKSSCPLCPELREALKGRADPKDAIYNLAFLLPEERQSLLRGLIIDTFSI
jgi:hypothetical protein